MGDYLFLLLILACPLAMIFMMRGMHGGQGGIADAGHGREQIAGCDHADGDSKSSVEELRRRREQLDREIEEREAEEQSSTPVGGAWR